MKNLKAKTVTKEQAYEVYKMRDWTWYVLKHYQAPEAESANEYARVFCLVVTPYTGPRGDLGDTYLRDIKSVAWLESRWCATCGAQVRALFAAGSYVCEEGHPLP